MSGRLGVPVPVSLTASTTRVYMARATTAHLVLADTPVSGAPRALCRMRPYQEKPWFGTGDQREYEKASRLPLCGKCSAAADAQAAVSGGTQ